MFDRYPVDSVGFKSCLQIGRGISIDFTMVVEFVKKAMELHGRNNYDCCFEQTQGVGSDIDRAV
jgi:hypothetical protein